MDGDPPGLGNQACGAGSDLGDGASRDRRSCDGTPCHCAACHCAACHCAACHGAASDGAASDGRASPDHGGTDILERAHSPMRRRYLQLQRPPLRDVLPSRRRGAVDQPAPELTLTDSSRTGGLPCVAVPAWKAIEQAEPEFAGRVRTLFEAGRHKTIATLRADGSPRISGIECEFADGDLRFGSMSGARKGVDLKRDPRFALHGPTFHPEEGKESEWPGEAKIAGRAIAAGPVTTGDSSEQADGEMFVAEIAEVVITTLNAEATKLVVESWTPERGLQRVERD